MFYTLIPEAFYDNTMFYTLRPVAFYYNNLFYTLRPVAFYVNKSKIFDTLMASMITAYLSA